jgi:hypothetical protein|tara:strand:- start:745 stop:1083 length:339 start_codon:yes stop_codon:yes gene_type:complete
MEDPKQIEDDSIVGTDTQGNELTHYVIAERLVALDCTIIIDDAVKYKDLEYLADKLSDGWRGYHRMSPGELWSEYKEMETQFFDHYDAGSLLCGLAEADPLTSSLKITNPKT